MEGLPEYKQVKQDKDFISIMKILQNVCYANKDGGVTLRPIMNILLAKKYVNYIMENNKSWSDFRDDVKMNYETWVWIAGQFPYAMCSLMTVLYTIDASKTWEDYIEMLKDELNALDI